MKRRITLRAEGLCHVFRSEFEQVPALCDVSLALRAGELCVVTGRSGSGKSTLLAALSGLLRPERGQVTVLGTPLWQLAERERELFRQRHFGFVFQGFHLFPALTASQQLELVLRWSEGLASAAARERAGRMLDLLGLAQHASKRPTQLSGGEKQRVAIGRALVKVPRLCFADEPTSALDDGNANNVISLFRRTADAGATVVMITHDKRLLPYADRVFELRRGVMCERLHRCGSSRSEQPPPARRTVQSFVPSAISGVVL